MTGVADFNHDGTSDILWNSFGTNLIWFIQNNQMVGGTNPPSTAPDWQITGVGAASPINTGSFANADLQTSQLVQAMASFSSTDSNDGAGSSPPQTSDQNLQLFASNPLH